MSFQVGRSRSQLKRASSAIVSEMLETRCLLSVTYTTVPVATFTSANAFPSGPLIFQEGTGNLYGVSENGGGDGGIGTVFEIPASGNGTITTLVSMGDQMAATPIGGLISDANGNFFGVAQGGGSAGAGLVFATNASGGLSPLGAFNGQSIENAVNATGPLVEVGSTLFGIALAGGTNNSGEVFSVPAGGGTLVDLAPFPSGITPVAGMVADSVGNLYGIEGGGNGSIFKVVGDSITPVASFAASDNAFPGGVAEAAPIIEINDNLWGVDAGGVFELASGSSTITQIGNTTGLFGQAISGLIADSSGDLFGATTSGVFEWTAATHSFSMIANLTGFPDGVTFGDNGDIFVTQFNGGANSDGMVNELVPSGSVTPPPTGSALTPTIVSSTVPSAVVGGGKLHGNVKVSLDNTGGTDEKGFTVNIYASSDTTADTLVTTVSKPTTIKPGKTASLTIPITSLPASLDGSFFLIAQTVDSASNTASAASGTQTTVAPPFVTLSETVTSTLATALVSGTTAKGTVTLTITNSGNVPSKGATGIDITASETSGVLGTSIMSLSKTLNILPGKSAKVVVPIKSIPALADGNYFIVAQVTDPFAGNTSIGSTAGTTTIAAPFITLAAALGPVTSIKAGDTLTLTDNGNIDDNAVFTATIGFSFDAAGAQPIGETASAGKTEHIKAGKSIKIHSADWAKILAGLEPGVPYFLTVSVTDGTHSAFAVSPNSFTLS